MAEPVVPRVEPQPQARQLWSSPNPSTFIENIAVRPNGSLLLTTFEQARLYALDPSSSSSTATVIASLPGVTALTGITPTGPDTYAIGAGTRGPRPFSFEKGMKVFLVSFPSSSSTAANKDEQQAPTIKLAASLPDSDCINGMASLPSAPHIVLAAHSFAGTIQRIDTLTGHVLPSVIADPLLSPDPQTCPSLPVGVNGIRVAADGYLYFANSARGLFGRVRIDPVTGERDGGDAEIEVLARHPGATGMGAAYDDFAVGGGGSVAYLGTHPERIMRVDLAGGGGRQEVLFDGVAGDVKLLAPTSCALSRDERALYVCTGGMDLTGEGMDKVGAQVVEITLP